MSKIPESPLKKFKPKIVTLNKKLIIVLAGILLIAVLTIMISSLSTPGPSLGTTRGAGIQGAANVPENPPADLSALPSDYSQTSQINDILAKGNAGMSRQAEAQINALQNAQQTLQAQLASLQQNQANGGGMGDALSQQAMTSSIFFAGGAPPPQNANATPATTANPAQTPAKPGDSTSNSNTYQQQNMQGQKLDFLTSKPNKNIYNDNTVQYPASPYILQAGSVIPAILQTKLVSNLPGVITALVSQDVYDSISGKYLLIPRGSKLIGEYNSSISYGQNQLQVKFTRLVRPDGSSIILPNQPGTDNMGSTGVEDEVNNHWGKIIGAAVMSAIFNIPSIIATNQMQTSNTSTCTNGVCTTTPSLGSTAAASSLQAAGQSASNVGNQLAQNSLNIQPTIIINSGYQFSVMVTKDIVLPPYNDSNTP